MPRGRYLLLTLPLVAACGVSLETPPSSTQISCASDAACPTPLTCHPSAQRCVDPETIDTTPPTVLSTASTDTTHVLIELSEEIDPDSIDRAVIGIAPALAITGRSQSTNLRELTLEVDTQTPGRDYTLTIASLADLWTNVMSESSQDFTGFGAFPERDPPKILVPLQDDISTSASTTLAWTHTALASHYTVDVSTAPNFSAPIAGSPFIIEEPNTSVTVPTAQPVRYYWRVRADTSRPLDAYSTSSFDIIGDTIYVYCPSSATTCDDAGLSGNIAAPLGSVQTALARATASGISRVLVAARGGGAAYPVGFSITDGVDLQGGFDGSFTTRDTAAFPTIITDANVVAAIADSGKPVSLDGLVLHGSAGAVRISSGYSSMITLSHLELIAEGTALAVVDSDEAHVLLTSSVIHGVGAKPLATGVHLSSAGARLVGNTITAQTTGVKGTNQSFVRMLGNTLTPGDGTNTLTAPLDLVDTAFVIDGNVVVSGTIPSQGGALSTNITDVINVPLTYYLFNNVFISGPTTDTGIYANSVNAMNGAAQSIIVANNTFMASASTTSTALAIQVAASDGQGHAGEAIFVDNIFVTLGGAKQICLQKYQGGSSLTDLRNNAFVACPVLYEFYPGAGAPTDLTAITDVNDGAQLQAPFAISDGGNVAVASLDTLALANAPSDAHLTSSSPTSVRYGGLDTSKSTCGGNKNVSCGPVTTDHDGGARTCPSAGNCYSMGAYESP